MIGFTILAAMVDWQTRAETVDGRLETMSTAASSTNELAYGEKDTGRAMIFVTCSAATGAVSIDIVWGERLVRGTTVQVEWQLDEGDTITAPWRVHGERLASTEEPRLARNLAGADHLTVRPLGDGRRQSAIFDLRGSRTAIGQILAACPLK